MATAEGWVIKRKLVRSERFNALNGDDFTQKVYCLLIACKDSWGMMPADPYTLKGILGPFDETHPPTDFETAVGKLAQMGLVYLWKNQESPWLYVVGHDDEHNPSRRKLQPEVPRPELAVINKEIRQLLTNSGLTKDLVRIKSATLPRVRERGKGKGVKGNGSTQNNSVSTEKPKKKPHPATEFMDELQHLSDLHAKLWGINPTKVSLDDNSRRIAKVYKKLGMEACTLVQEGHKILNRDDRYSSWPYAFPAVRDGGKRKATEPNWSWIEDHRAAGAKATRRREHPEDEPFL